MKFSYEHPAIVPLTIEINEGDPIKHSAANNWTCLDITCPCKFPGMLAWRDAELRRLKANVTQQTDEQTAILPRWPGSIPSMPDETWRLASIPRKRRTFWRSLWHRLQGK